MENNTKAVPPPKSAESGGGGGGRRKIIAATSVQFIRELSRRRSTTNIQEATAAAAAAAAAATAKKDHSGHAAAAAASGNSLANSRIKAKVSSLKMMKKGNAAAAAAASKSKGHANTLSVKSHHNGKDHKRKSNTTTGGHHKLSPSTDMKEDSSKNEKLEDVESSAEEAAAEDTTEENNSRPTLKKQTSLDRLMEQVLSLKSLYPQIVENAARRKIEKEEEGEEEEEVIEPEEQENAAENEVKDEEEEEELQDLKNDDDSDEGGGSGGDQVPNPVPVSKENLSAICSAFSGGKTSSGGRKSLKAVAKEEIIRGEEMSILDKMMATSQTMAVGRRQFDADEIEVEVEEEPDEEQERKAKIRDAKPRYMQMYSKPEPEPKPEEVIDTNPKSYGLWDSCTDVKILPTLLKVKREWHPPDWERILQNMKEEGRDAASIDADLRELSQTRDFGRKKTGKYLMPEDLQWCRKHSRFRERDMLTWFKRYRAETGNSGQMGKEQFGKLFKAAFPFSDEQEVADIIYELFDPEGKEGLDFKDFLVTMDVVTCKTTLDKFKWATALFDKKRLGTTDHEGIRIVLKLMDQVEENGFMDPPTQDELDEITYRRKLEPLKLVDDRVADIWRLCDVTADGRVELADLYRMAERMVYTRD